VTQCFIFAPKFDAVSPGDDAAFDRLLYAG
jgi:hypothetical protein